MIRLVQDSLKVIREMPILLKEVEEKCETAVFHVHSNGVVLEELKRNNYKSLK